MSIITNTTSRRSKYIVFIGLYIIGLVLSKYLGFDLLKMGTGLTMLFILPGYLLSPFLHIHNHFNRFFSFFISVPISIAVFSVALLIYSKLSSPYTEIRLTALFIMINVLIILCTTSIRGGGELFLPPPFKSIFSKKNALIVSLILLPFVVLALTWLIYPFFPGDDTYNLINALKEPLNTNSLIHPILDRRPLFTPFILLVNYATGFSIIQILKFVLPSITIVSFILPCYKFIQRSKNNDWRYLIFPLIYLSSPYLLYYLGYAIPQSFILILTIPILILIQVGLEKNDVYLIYLALLMAFISVSFHELGFVLVLTSLIGYCIYFVRKNKQTNWKGLLNKITIGGIIIFPYFIIFQVFNKAQVLTAILSSVGSKVVQNIQLRWWYVDYYLNPDGIIFSYPGWKGILWYGYLGALIFVPFFILGIAVLIYSNKLKKLHSKLNRVQLLYSYTPLIFFIAVFFFIAEIVPRFSKVAFLPERAWVFLSIGVGTSVIELSYFILKNKSKVSHKLYTQSRNLALITTLICVVIGVAANLYLSKNRGILLSKDEIHAIEFVKERTPSDSVFVSTQTHGVGIPIFGNRKFIYLPTIIASNSYNSFKTSVLSTFANKNIKTPHKYVGITYDFNNEPITIDEKILASNDTIEKKYPIYFIYSLKRFDNTQFIGNPNYFDQNDYKRKDVYFSDDYLANSVYHDNDVVIFNLQ